MSEKEILIDIESDDVTFEGVPELKDNATWVNVSPPYTFTYPPHILKKE